MKSVVERIKGDSVPRSIRVSSGFQIPSSTPKFSLSPRNDFVVRSPDSPEYSVFTPHFSSRWDAHPCETHTWVRRSSRWDAHPGETLTLVRRSSRWDAHPGPGETLIKVRRSDTLTKVRRSYGFVFFLVIAFRHYTSSSRFIFQVHRSLSSETHSQKGGLLSFPARLHACMYIPVIFFISSSIIWYPCIFSSRHFVYLITWDLVWCSNATVTDVESINPAAWKRFKRNPFLRIASPFVCALKDGFPEVLE